MIGGTRKWASPSEFLTEMQTHASNYGCDRLQYSNVLCLLWKRSRLRRELDALAESPVDMTDEKAVMKRLEEFEELTVRMHAILVAFDESIRLLEEPLWLARLSPDFSQRFRDRAHTWRSPSDILKTHGELAGEIIDKWAQPEQIRTSLHGRTRFLVNLEWLLDMVFTYTPEGSTAEAIVLRQASRVPGKRDINEAFKMHFARVRVWRRILGRLVFAQLGTVTLLIPLVVLFFIQELKWRILPLCGFALSFGTLVGLSQAAPSDTLGGIAAFIAVMVVFVGSTSPGLSA